MTIGVSQVSLIISKSQGSYVSVSIEDSTIDPQKIDAWIIQLQVARNWLAQRKQPMEEKPCPNT